MYINRLANDNNLKVNVAHVPIKGKGIYLKYIFLLTGTKLGELLDTAT